MTTTTQQPVIDLVSLIEQNTGFRAVGTANNRLHGKEHYGMCPYCGTGEDRFHVFPESASPKPHFFCRVCKKVGDHIDILTEFRNMTYVEACAELGISPGDTISREPSILYDDQPPPPKWQSMARILVERAQTYLWSNAHHALEYLLKRGFSETTIKNAHLGYIPLLADGTWFQRPFSDWGLTDEMLTQKQKDKGKISIPPGILIPWYADGYLWKLAVKRFEARDNEMPYGQVIGSKNALYNADSLQRDKPALLLEGELDVLSAVQEARDLIAPIGTGSTEKARIPLWIARMASLADGTLVALDSDQAGDKASNFWLDTLPNSMRWTPFVHDVNDMLKANISIRDWVKLGLEVAVGKPDDESPLAREPVTKAFGDDLSLVCSACGDPVEYYSPDGISYCEGCWSILQTPVKQTEIYRCKQCQRETLRGAPDGLCAKCFMMQFPQANPPREPVTTRDAWSR